MKVLIDGRLYGLENAGLGRYINNLIDQLTKIDSENEYIVLLRKKYFDSLNLPTNWKKVLADFRHYSFAEQLRLPKLISKENPDLVHFPHFNVPLFFNGKYVVTIHDLLMHQQKGLDTTTLPVLSYLVKRFFYHMIFRNAVQKSCKILVPSESVKKDLIEYYKIKQDKVVVVYEGVDKNILAVKDYRDSPPYFVYIGNAYPHKNLKRLIQAIVLLNKDRDKNNKINLIIASARNVFTKRVEDLIDKFGANDFVKFVGFVPDNKLGSLYKNSLGFVFPSLSEGFGLPGLEAIKTGTLLLASEIPVFKEIYRDNAVYFDPNSAVEIEKAMKKVLEMDLHQRKKIIEKGQVFVKKYSWAKMAQETLNIYAGTFKKENSNSVRQG